MTRPNMLAALALAAALGAGTCGGAVALMQREVAPTETLICHKPAEDEHLGGCGLDYRDGAWYVTLPHS